MTANMAFGRARRAISWIIRDSSEVGGSTRAFVRAFAAGAGEEIE